MTPVEHGELDGAVVVVVWRAVVVVVAGGLVVVVVVGEALEPQALSDTLAATSPTIASAGKRRKPPPVRTGSS